MKELIKFFGARLKRDGIAQEAAALAYTTILSLIPLITVIVAVFAMIPSFEPVKESLRNFVTENFMPVFTDAVGNAVSSFVAHAGSMTVTSVAVLFVISLMLIRSIDKALNRIWRGGRRSFGATVAVYWTLLTLGPLTVGLVLWLSTRLLALDMFYNVSISGVMVVLYSVFPWLVEIAMVTTLFLAVPMARVKVRDALMGGILTTLLFEVSKRCFSAFILHFSNYEAIYGALAALPVLMIWIYLNWWLILIGAEFTAVLGIARTGVRNEVPEFMYFLANATGSTQGSDSATNLRKHSRIHIRISRSQD